MGNFLPLIEAFIAFALTMLALATAVSSVFGGIQRAKRSHARGMREMMKYYYRNEVQPFLAVQGLAKTTYEASFRFPTAVIGETKIDQTALIGYGSGARKIVEPLSSSAGDVKFDPDNKRVIIFTATTKDANGTPAQQGANGTEPQTIKYRVETDFSDTSNKVGKPMNMFLVDMTQLPIPITGEIEDKDSGGQVKTDKEGNVVKIQDLQARERLVEKDDFTSLRYTVENLTDEEFTTRLRASEVGRTIADTRSPAERDLCYGRLLERFRAHSRAATERFTRRARAYTVILGFLLAFLMNIDSINLLSRYLRDNDLVQTVLQNTDKIVNAAKASDQSAPPAAADDANPPVGPAPGSDPVQEKLAKIDGLIGKLNAITEAAKVDAGESQSARIQEAVEAVQDGLKNIGEASSEAQKVVHTINSAVAQMTEGFPVGWNLYPNCARGSTATRCVTLSNLGKVSPYADKPGFGAAFRNVGFVAVNDFGGFSKWFLGVFITGIMAGLGAPFWMEVVNNFLRARNLINNSREPGRGRRPV